MHILQSKHSKLKAEEAKKILEKFRITPAQLPKIKKEDPALPENCQVGDIIKIERKDGERIVEYYRVVI